MLCSGMLPLFASPWANPEERPRLFREALEALSQGDPEPLLRGFRAYLSLRGASPRSVELRLQQVRDFLRYLMALRGPEPLRWERGDYLRYREDLHRRGASPKTLLSHYYGVRAFLDFLLFAGHTPPPLDFPLKERAPRTSYPLSREEYLHLLDLLEGWRSQFREPLALLMVVMGEGGLLVKEALALTLDHVDPAGRLRLPGGWVDLSRRGTQVLQRYLDYRQAVQAYPTRHLFLDPRGRPLTQRQATQALHAFTVFSEYPVNALRLRLTGRTRLIERYGTREAKRLLRRTFI